MLEHLERARAREEERVQGQEPAELPQDLVGLLQDLPVAWYNPGEYLGNIGGREDAPKPYAQTARKVDVTQRVAVRGKPPFHDNAPGLEKREALADENVFEEHLWRQQSTKVKETGSGRQEVG